MGFMDVIAKAQTGTNNQGDYFMADTTGTVEILQMKHNSGFKGDTVALECRIITSQPKVTGGPSQTPGTIVKKLYLLTKYPEVAPSQLKTDILAIIGASPSDVSEKQMGEILHAIFENQSADEYGLKGVKAKFDTKTIDRSAKGKAPIVSVKFASID